jgi:phenylacetic acid degradation operon negative regulatory protein
MAHLSYLAVPGSAAAGFDTPNTAGQRIAVRSGAQPAKSRSAVAGAGRYVAGVTTLSTAAGTGEPRASPRALIVTIYGLYARDHAGAASGWLSVASLIRLMAGLGVDQAAVRSSISRLKQRGILQPLRVSGSAGYALSPRGRQILAEGDSRIFARPRARLSDGWLLAVFSVPEQERRQRHALRSRLSWLGFGTVSAGVWIAPGHLAGETRDVLARYGLAGYVDLFSAGYLAFGDLREQVGRWWDLDRLERLYQEFLDDCGPVLERWRGRRATAGADGGAAFADYVLALTAWRRLPYLDPGLPAELLPADWHGLRAARTFAALRARLAGPARAHVLVVTGPPG